MDGLASFVAIVVAAAATTAATATTTTTDPFDGPPRQNGMIPFFQRNEFGGFHNRRECTSRIIVIITFVIVTTSGNKLVVLDSHFDCRQGFFDTPFAGGAERQCGPIGVELHRGRRKRGGFEDAAAREHRRDFKGDLGVSPFVLGRGQRIANQLRRCLVGHQRQGERRKRGHRGVFSERAIGPFLSESLLLLPLGCVVVASAKSSGSARSVSDTARVVHCHIGQKGQRRFRPGVFRLASAGVVVVVLARFVFGDITNTRRDDGSGIVTIRPANS
mmetsp:Transcript_52282/g.59327  ORF Transcript_52282/g.59327 Transcript_52282/m.59327 type:complete len:274 (+) Transcript_52282:402-1223(+)